MFQTIKGIDIGQGPGEAFGGGIYAASCEIGFSNAPTKITLNVVSESGIYNSIYPNVYSTKYNIDLNGKVFAGMYLYAYEKSKSAGSSLMTLNFIDSSIVLDKVFIGLLNRHGNKRKSTNIATGTFTVRCPSCDDGLIVNRIGQARRYLDEIPGGQYFKKGEDGGGYIILGKENFAENNCEIPKVDYNFSELCAALTAYGLKHELNIFDLNPLYRQEYAGTIREVLNNWASDFSFEFYFDGDVLKAIDLRRPINITALQSFAENNAYVTQASYAETLDNTYAQSVVARYLKASEAIEYDHTFNFKKVASPITINHILENGNCAGRNGEMLATCIALSRLDNSLREAYIANYAILNNTSTPLQALGFLIDEMAPHPITNVYDKDTLINNFSPCAGMNNSSPSNLPPCQSDNYAIFLGLFSEELKQSIEQWDLAAADFWGKFYYFNENLPSSSFDCPYAYDWFIYYTYNGRWSTVPASDIHGNKGYPFANLIRGPIINTPLAALSAKNIFNTSDNEWGIDQDTYDIQRGAMTYDELKPKIVPIRDFPNPTIWTQIVTNARVPTMIADLMMSGSIAKNTIPVYCIVPLMDKMPYSPKISAMGRTVNFSAYNRVAGRTDYDERASTCLTYCDSNIVSEICNCGSKYTPTPYFQNLFAPYFSIYHNTGNISNVVFPVDANYFGFFELNQYFKTTYPPVKVVYGEPPESPNNSLSTKIIDYDITPDLEAVRDNNDAVNLYIYSPTNGAVMEASEYYEALANLNDLVVPAQKSVEFTVAKANLNTLGIPLSPANGLTSMNISLSEGGLQTQLKYATRPPVVPKAEAIYAKIKYRLNR